MNKVYRILIFLLVVSIAACTSTQSTIIGGNDEDQDIGLGGTGVLAKSGDSGLGGTGILGEITGFGSIFVNGIEVDYDSDTTFTVDGKAAGYQELEIGDVVEILTTDTNDYTQAQIINLRHEVIGQVDSVESETLSFTVRGQNIVQVDRESLPEVGATVAVSGFRVNENTIASTRVTSADAKQTLLRTQTVLPFKQKTATWLVQTFVNDNKAVFQLGDETHVVSTKDKIGASAKDRSGTSVLLLQKPMSGQLKLKRVIEQKEMPRGVTPIQLNTGRMPSSIMRNGVGKNSLPGVGRSSVGSSSGGGGGR
jgi:hypothetical protein